MCVKWNCDETFCIIKQTAVVQPRSEVWVQGPLKVIDCRKSVACAEITKHMEEYKEDSFVVVGT